MTCKYLFQPEGEGELCLVTGKVCSEWLDAKSELYVENCPVKEEKEDGL